MKMAVARIWLGAVLAVWAILSFVLALYFDAPLNSFDLGPSAFPMIISASLFLTSAWLIIQEARHLPESAPVKVNRFFRNLVSAAIILAYAWAMPYAGYYAATLLFVPAFLISSGERRWKWILLTTACLLLFNYFSFDRLLGVSLPKMGAAFIQ